MAEISNEYSWVPIGFHFALDRAHHVWRFAGSPADIGLFPILLRGVAAAGPSEAVGLGPDREFTIGVWETPGIDDEGVFGPADSLNNLADAIDSHLQGTSTGEFRASEEFLADSHYSLMFDVDDAVSGAYYASPTSHRETNTTPVGDLPAIPPLRFSFIGLADDLVSEGLMHVGDNSVFLEFELKEEDDPVRLPEVYETTLEFSELSSVELKRSIFGPVVTITSHRMKGLAKLPSSKAGRIKLRFKRKDADDVERMVALFSVLLGS